MDMIFTFEDGSESLAHYGVLGMKWGKWNAETARRRAGGGQPHKNQYTGNESKGKRFAKNFAFEQKNIDVPLAVGKGIAAGIISGNPAVGATVAGASYAVFTSTTLAKSGAQIAMGRKTYREKVEESMAEAKRAVEKKQELPKGNGHPNDDRFINNFGKTAQQVFEEKAHAYDGKNGKELAKAIRPEYGDQTLKNLVDPTPAVKAHKETYKKAAISESEKLADMDPLNKAHRNTVSDKLEKYRNDHEFYTELGQAKKAVIAEAKANISNDWLMSYDREDFGDKYDRLHW